jgi:uncharacterized protein (TIGR02284 family)
MYQRAVDTMNHLIRTDRDAARVYEAALRSSEDEDLRARFATLRDEHERHVDRLSKLVADRGGVPEPHRDLEGYFLEELAVLEVHDRPSALRAAHHAARHAFKVYEDAMGEELEAEVIHAIRDGYEETKNAHAWLDALIVEDERRRTRRSA